MKRFTVFESGVIGFFAGVIASTYILYVENTGGYIGSLLNDVSLRPILMSMKLSGNMDLYIGLFFFIVVYTIYGLIAGFIINKKNWTAYIIIPLIIIVMAGIVIEQKKDAGVAQNPQVPGDQVQPYAIVPSLRASVMSAAGALRGAGAESGQEYFGIASTTEAHGDLNGDGKDDVAFILSGYPSGHEYLSAALATTTGHIGTNLLYMGDEFKPQTIYVTGGIITVTNATSSKNIYAHVVNGVLEQIKPLKSADNIVWGTVSLNTIANGNGTSSQLMFNPCGTSATLLLTATGTLYQTIQNELGSSTLLALVIGQHRSLSLLSSKNTSTTSYSGTFSTDNIVTFIPGGSCM